MSKKASNEYKSYSEFLKVFFPKQAKKEKDLGNFESQDIGVEMAKHSLSKIKRKIKINPLQKVC